MGNKKIIVKPNGTRRKVCERTQKVIIETNFCWCGNKHCHEGYRMNSEKALCKVRRFREKFRPILIDDYYDDYDYDYHYSGSLLMIIIMIMIIMDHY
jgi:hypothetical protein